MNNQLVPDILANDKYSLPFGVRTQRKPIKIEGIAAWGSAGEGKWAFKIGKTPIDTIISTRQIVIQIYMYPTVFEITTPQKEHGIKTENLDKFVTGLKNFVTKKGYQFKALPATKIPPALPSPIEETEVTESFEGFITKIEDNLAFVTLVDDAGEKSYMEIPIEDIQRDKIECKLGIIFSFLLRRRGNWEKVEFSPIQRPSMTKAKIDELINYYKEKYGDV
jgi:hypothetical protein